MKELVLISDIHGCHKTLLALLEKANPNGDREVYFLGDMIDRGPNSRGVLEYAIANAVKCVMGNHEHMMLCAFDKLPDSPYINPSIWLMNGGVDALKSFEHAVPDSILNWVSNIPYYIIPKDYPELLLSHTGHGMNPNKFDGVWCRETSFPKDDYYRVFGHTQETKPIITEKWAMIDTGCAYVPYYGKLTAMIWPTKEIIQQNNIDKE